MCLIMAYLAGSFFNNTHQTDTSDDQDGDQYHFSYIYEDEDVYTPEVLGVISYFSFFLLFNTMVPISLIISLETLKQLQTVMIEYDDKIRQNNDKNTFKILNTMIHEELARVDYIFSDKTGTLTANQMVFKGCCIRGIQYTDEDIKEILSNQIEGIEQRQGILLDPELQDFLDFWLCVTICHEVIIDETVKGQLIYQGSSPDEVCLVQSAATNFNFTFLKRTNTSIMVKVEEEVLEYQILLTIPFSSDRKRMSIAVKYKHSSKIILYIKGADNIILSRLDMTKNSEQTTNMIKYSLKKYSKDGLRTLCLACRELDESFFLEWLAEYQKLQKDLMKAKEENEGAIKKKLEEHEDLVEKNLLLLGSTALEDKLQDGVPETITDLHKAGIKIWMLTGDKLETAENIGYLCNLIDKRTKKFRIQAMPVEDIVQRFNRIKKKMKMLQARSSKGKLQREDSYLKMQLAFLQDQQHSNSQVKSVKNRISRNLSMKSQSLKSDYLSNHKDTNKAPSASNQTDAFYNSYALVIEGEAINSILNSKEISTIFLNLIPQCRTVICCRSTPNQKAEVVKFVKKNLKVVTLAIGDGGNDVTMIQQAEIGIGIMGNEGKQAADSSDYYFKEFKDLWRLLFIHGRWSLFRTTYFINFFFFKNILFTFQQFYFAFYSGFSAQTFWESGYLLNFNTIVTAVAPVYFGAFDQDLQPHKSEFIMRNLPKVYAQFKKYGEFGYFRFFLWFIGGIGCSALIFYWSMEAQSFQILSESGQGGGLWQLSLSCYWSSVFISFVVILMDSSIFTWLTFISYFFFSLVLFFPVFVLVYDQVSGPVNQMAVDTLSNFKFYTIVSWNVLLVVIGKTLYRFWQFYEKPTIVDLVIQKNRQLEELQKKKVDDKESQDQNSFSQKQDVFPIQEDQLKFDIQEEQKEEDEIPEDRPAVIKNIQYTGNHKHFKQ